ncbi:MAG: hypothetical protein HY927_07490 [Elusimicrobia bacterium]|nr:hypothetical protein [Elusimicrobiota bacterium]
MVRSAVIALLVCGLAPPTARAAVVKPEAHGRLTNRYTQDNWGAYEEKRLSTYFQMDAQKIFWDKLSAEISLRNDVRAEGKGLKFNENFLKVFTGNAALDKLPGGFSARLGRQYYYGAETTVNFDGGNVDWRRFKWLEAGAFAGAPVTHVGEPIGRLFQGGYVKLLKGYKSHLRAGALRVLHFAPFRPEDEVELSVYHRLTAGLNARGRASLFNGRPKNAAVNVNFSHAPWGLTINPAYYMHLYVADLADFSKISPYARTFAHFERYDRVGVDVTKTVGGHFSLNGLAEGYFPRKRQRFSLGLSGWDLPWKGVNFSASGVRNLSENADNLSFTGTLGYRRKGVFECSAGLSATSDVTQSFYGEKTTRNETYFGSLKYFIRKDLDISAAPSVTKLSDSADRMYRVEVRNNWRF